MNCLIILNIFYVIIGLASTTSKLPFKKCPASKNLDDNLNECLKVAIQDAIRELAVNDHNELGVKILDPLTVKQMSINKTQGRSIDLNIIFSDIQLRGATDLKILNVGGRLSNPSDFEMTMEAEVPEIRLTGPYDISGNVMIMPIQGSGDSNITIRNPKINITLKARSQMKDDKEYLRVNEFKLDIIPELVNVRFDKLYRGKEELGESTNTLINQHWEELFTELKPSIDESFSDVFREYATRILEHVPYKDLFDVE